MSYIKIPEQVERSEFLCPMSKLLFGRIHSLSQKEGYCWATNQHFAEWYNCSQSQVTRWISELTRAGFIECEIIKKSNVRRIEISANAISKNADTPKQKCADRIRKNADTPKQKCVISNNLIGINKEELTNVGVGNFQLPCPEKEKKQFSDWLVGIGLTRLSQTCFFLKEEKSCAKKEEIGEARFLAALTAIDEYLATKPDFLQGSPDFDKVLQKFITPPSLFAAQSAFSSFFATKYGQSYKSYTKADNAALNKILKALESQSEAKHLSVQDRANQFFEALAHLPQFDNPLKAKISFISADIFQILAALKKPNFGVGSFGETYKERDARNQMEQHKAQRSRIEEQCFYQQEKEQILRFLENNIPLTDAMKSTQAYKDVFGATPF